jgi:hypothetical protein
VMDTLPQSADADVAPNDSATAADAASILSFMIVSLFNLRPDLWPLRLIARLALLPKQTNRNLHTMSGTHA